MRLFFLLVAALAASCLVEGFVLLESSTGSGAGGQAMGGAAGSAGTAGNACGHVTVPPPPGSTAPGSEMEIVLAMRSLDLGEGDLSMGPLVGYDLDARCSCLGESASCIAPRWANVEVCDGPDGRDNALAWLFESASVFLPQLASSALSGQIEIGNFSLLVRIRGYNGEPNDDAVEVAVFGSPGRDKDACLGMPPPPPMWTGHDSWPLASTSLMMGGGGMGGAGGSCGAPGYDLEMPRYVDARAYVTDGVLVATFDELSFFVRTGDRLADVHLRVVSLNGRLTQQGALWKLDEGTIAGRWPVEELRLAFVALASSGPQLCTDDPLYENLKTAVCDHVDITSALSGPTTPCDAASFGMAFVAEPAVLGAVWEPPNDPSPCAPGTIPAEDNCAM